MTPLKKFSETTEFLLFHNDVSQFQNSIICVILSTAHIQNVSLSKCLRQQKGLVLNVYAQKRFPLRKNCIRGGKRPPQEQFSQDSELR
jgi:hypothetical protein